MRMPLLDAANQLEKGKKRMNAESALRMRNLWEIFEDFREAANCCGDGYKSWKAERLRSVAATLGKQLTALARLV